MEIGNYEILSLIAKAINQLLLQYQTIFSHPNMDLHTENELIWSMNDNNQVKQRHKNEQKRTHSMSEKKKETKIQTCIRLLLIKHCFLDLRPWASAADDNNVEDRWKIPGCSQVMRFN